jgi:ribosomal protein L29
MQMGQMDGVKKYRALRKDLARLLTVERERASAQQ